MKEEIISLICKAVKESLDNHVLEKNKEVIANPREFNILKKRIISSCFMGIITKKILGTMAKNNLDEDLKTIWEQWEYIPLENDYSSINNLDYLIIKDFYEKIKVNNISLMELYELMLSVDFYLKEGKVDHSKIDNSHRNRLGSYYTPNDFANSCVKITFDNYIEKKLGIRNFSNNPIKKNKVSALLKESKIIDFSCGNGRFLLAALVYIQKYVLEKGDNGKSLKQFIRTIYGVDVDYLALEIAKIELSFIIGDTKILSALKSNFIHGNPLLKNSEKVQSKTKEEIFNSGFIYHKKLGVELGSLGRFDIILGNPPWEKIRFEEKNFFKNIYPEILSFHNKRERNEKIEKITKLYPKINDFYLDYKQSLENSKIEIKKEFKYSAKGEINTYALFTELAVNNLSNMGVIGLIVKSALVTSPANKKLFNYLVFNNKILSVYDFINIKGIFDIDRRERFSFLSLGNSEQDSFSIAMNLKEPTQMFNSNLMQLIDKDLLKKVNPQTLMLPNTQSQEQLNILLSIVEKNPMFCEVYKNANFGRIVHFTSHANHIHTTTGEDLIPIYEGKFIHQYDGKYSGFDEIPHNRRYENKTSAKLIPEHHKEDLFYIPESRFFIEREKWNEINKRYTKQYSLMWRSLTSSTNKRTCIATILPHIPTSQSIQLLQLEDNADLAILLAIFNSLPYDYLVRINLNGIDLTQSIIKQLPIPSKEVYNLCISFAGVEDIIKNHIIRRVCSLFNNDARLKNFCNEINPNNRELKTKDRRIIQTELDILIALAYKINSKDFRKMLEEFESSLSNEEINWYEKNIDLLPI